MSRTLERPIGRRTVPGRWLVLLALPAVFAAVWIWVAVAGAGSELARAQLLGLRGQVVGEFTFSQAGGAARVAFSVRGLPAGFHGFHIHTIGVCDAAAGFRSVGDHYDHAHREQPFDGDMPPILVASDGTGTGSFVTGRFTVTDVEGMSAVVHVFPDNFANIPVGDKKDQYRANDPRAVARTSATGNAGLPLACGVIRKIR